MLYETGKMFVILVKINCCFSVCVSFPLLRKKSIVSVLFIVDSVALIFSSLQVGKYHNLNKSNPS